MSRLYIWNQCATYVNQSTVSVSTTVRKQYFIWFLSSPKLYSLHRHTSFLIILKFNFTASCYHMNNIMGLLACSTFIGSNFSLALNLSTQDMTPLDIFLSGISITNYLFLQAIKEWLYWKKIGILDKSWLTFLKYM